MACSRRAPDVAAALPPLLLPLLFWRRWVWHGRTLREANAKLAALNAELEAELARSAEARAAAEESEARFRQSQKMEAIGQLTGGIAHDFNNMLQAMQGSVQLARRKLEAAAPDRQKILALLDNSLDAGGKAARLTTQLLAFSRRQRLDPMPVDPTEVARGMMQVVRTSAGDRIVVRESVAPGVGICLADRSQLQQALLNLVNNARDAINGASGAGTVTVGLRAVTLPASDDPERPRAGPYVCLSVRDDGPGMDEETRSRAFEPFFTTKPPGQGTGLGLSSLYGFARQSGGWASIASAPGEGAEVSIYLPRLGDAAPAAPPDRPAAPPAAPRRGTRLLVVEDDPMVREALSATLEDMGYAVEQAETGPEGLAALEAGRFDALLTDLAMPGMVDGQKYDGLDLLREAARRWPRLPLVMLTGNPSPPGDGERPAGSVLLTKPYPPGALGAALAGLLERVETEGAS